MRRATDLSGQLDNGLDALRAETTSADARASYDAASAALSDLLSIDKRVRDSLSERSAVRRVGPRLRRWTRSEPATSTRRLPPPGRRERQNSRCRLRPYDSLAIGAHGRTRRSSPSWRVLVVDPRHAGPGRLRSGRRRADDSRPAAGREACDSRGRQASRRCPRRRRCPFPVPELVGHGRPLRRLSRASSTTATFRRCCDEPPRSSTRKASSSGWPTGPGSTLRPSLTHGYSDKVIAKLGVLDVAADNVTSLSFRSMRPQIDERRLAGIGGRHCRAARHDAGCVGRALRRSPRRQADAPTRSPWRRSSPRSSRRSSAPDEMTDARVAQA